MKIALLTIALLSLAVVLLGVKVFFVKNGKFPSGHVHDIEPLRRKGIGCASGTHSDGKADRHLN